ncbi:unnamed protein product [Rotaria socialis]|uniref:Uncharacterized protein n=1 Tax=Rotaria socialis TaxID=392032 RepID=A0A821IP55_9BILA|nr:unnamed protein product [Rotaria socialis]
MEVDGEVEVEADLTTSASTTVLTTTTTTSGSHSSIPVRVILPTSYLFELNLLEISIITLEESIRVNNLF